MKGLCHHFNIEVVLTNYFQEYSEFLQEFMSAVKQNYGEKVLIQVSHSLQSSTTVHS